MAYKLAEEDKLCGIEYPTYEGYKPIPKATCEMLETQCGGIEIVFNCEKKKEEKPTPKPTPQPEPTPEEPKPQPEEPTPTPNPDPEVPTPEPEPTPKPVLTNEELDEIVSGKLRNDGTLGKYNANQNNKLISVDEPTPEEIEAYKKEITDKVGDIPELEGYTVEVSVDKIPSEAPEVGSDVTGAPLYTKIVKITKPNGDVYQSEPMSIGTTTETTIDLLEALPEVTDKFSKLITKDGQVVEVPEVSEEDKRAFEDKIINDLKAKLPEGTTVEAVLEGPAYEKGSEVLTGKTNYTVNVRTTLNGKVSEHTYKVPHTDEPAKEEPAEEAPDVERDNLTTELKSLYSSVVLGTLKLDIINSYEKSSNYQKEFLEQEVNKIRERYPEYTIGYTLQEPGKEPKKIKDLGNEYYYLAMFTVTKGNKSTEVPVYLTYGTPYTDHI